VIPKNCKRLAAVDFPIAEVSRHAAREESIRHGHPSTLRLWWARWPRASSRAMLLALLWPEVEKVQRYAIQVRDARQWGTA
jgi:adenine-specific DNA methylase